MRAASLNCAISHDVKLTIFAAIGTLMDCASAINEARGGFDYCSFLQKLLNVLGGRRYVELLLENVKHDTRFQNDSDEELKCISQHLTSLSLNRGLKSDGNFDLNPDIGSSPHIDQRLSLGKDRFKALFEQILELAQVPKGFIELFPKFWIYWEMKQKKEVFRIGLSEITSVFHQFCCYLLVTAMFDVIQYLPAAELLGLKSQFLSNINAMGISSFMDYFLESDEDGCTITIFPFQDSPHRQARWTQAFQSHMGRSFGKGKPMTNWDCGNNTSKMALMICLCAQLDNTLGMNVRSLIEKTTKRREAYQLLRCIYGSLGVNSIILASATATRNKEPRAVAHSVLEAICMINTLEATCKSLSGNENRRRIVKSIIKSSVIENPGEVVGLHITVSTSTLLCEVDPDPATKAKGVVNNVDYCYMAIIASFQMLLDHFISRKTGNADGSLSTYGKTTDNVKNFVDTHGFKSIQGLTADTDPNDVEFLSTDLKSTLRSGVSSATLHLDLESNDIERFERVLKSMVVYPQNDYEQTSDITDEDEDSGQLDGGAAAAHQQFDQESENDEDGSDGEDKSVGVGSGEQPLGKIATTKGGKNLKLLLGKKAAAKERVGGRIAAAKERVGREEDQSRKRKRKQKQQKQKQMLSTGMKLSLPELLFFKYRCLPLQEDHEGSLEEEAKAQGVEILSVAELIKLRKRIDNLFAKRQRLIEENRVQEQSESDSGERISAATFFGSKRVSNQAAGDVNDANVTFGSTILEHRFEDRLEHHDQNQNQENDDQNQNFEEQHDNDADQESDQES
eukprot:scaffold2634_cov108-Skeletonema_menzelii.AAC.6